MEKSIIIIVSLFGVVILLAYLNRSADVEVKGGAIMEDVGASELATFAGGCFWCMESAFEHVDGIGDVTSGYSGGDEQNPSYEDVSSGETGHFEAIQVSYDPKKISYSKLLDVFWMNIDPTDDGGQFADRGKQYKTAIFYHNEKQKDIAEKSKDALNELGKFDKPIATQIIKFTSFYPAESYHQDYYKKNPSEYKSYSYFSGRAPYVEKTWGDEKIQITPVDAEPEVIAKDVKPSDEKLKEMLTDIQYRVTQKEGTEPPFNNEYWDNKEEGIYVDVISGEPLFSSKDKYKSGTGWPSFTKPLDEGNILEKTDRTLGVARVEIRSKDADSHLGHVFEDGPAPTGRRYCMNSAALRFIPVKDLEKEGYGQYKGLFA